MAQETAAQHHGGEIRLQHQRLAQGFHHDHGLDTAGAEAAIVFGERQPKQALSASLPQSVLLQPPFSAMYFLRASKS